MKVKLAQVLVMLLLVSGVSIAEEPQIPSISAIASAAEAVVIEKIDAPANARISVEAQSLESRGNIPRCEGPVSARLATDRPISRNNTVRISCISPDLDYPWQMFLSVRADVLFPVVVAKRPLGNGDLLDSESIEVRYVDRTLLRGQQFVQPEPLYGSRVKRRIPQDAPIFADNLCFVCKGDAVAIYAKSAGFEIKTQGEALADGNEGDRIRIRNINSNRTLEATVIGVGEVEVKM
ncbi:flagellar basal body P-ring formation chaperone FlgA [Shewanella litorisediminis]|uniref:Flagella basal body P-ring formation protein FlgA n=1 Tax=Shewanella litorisediminis TaxID=1173586 RepID=A0ABX7FZZ4_9GAMM|nr:flagellar basal body P-ring formation chaperone FlgA [Shewanella litorisediminis]MCL2919704.1 flagellar basal body P-ring formation protein FlgA [Shewanella litorisediminis]QRH00588.1 flagellar basal body P-ring formation protein FlgA [Shewanella litorisediminis]